MNWLKRFINAILVILGIRDNPTPVPNPVPTPTTHDESISEDLIPTDDALTSIVSNTSVSFEGTADSAISPIIIDGVEYLPAELPLNLRLHSYKTLSNEMLVEISRALYTHYSEGLNKEYYKPVIESGKTTLLSDLSNDKFRDYVFGLEQINENRYTVWFGGGYTVQSNRTIIFMRNSFSTITPMMNQFFWAFVNDAVTRGLGNTDFRSNDIVKFIFAASNTEMLQWFRDKARGNFRVGRSFPDALRIFSLVDATGSPSAYETTTTYSVLVSYSKFTQVPVYVP
jgi:hypothetical protein